VLPRGRSSSAPRDDGAGTALAVYTRRSFEEGLEQDFNSLDAQRDACEAFIRSQGGEG
jgi:site-specific DNA recombinase